MRKTKFKVGDKVRLKKNLIQLNKYGQNDIKLTLYESMVFYGFKEIISVDCIGICEIVVKYGNFLYTPEMLTKSK